MTTCPNCGIPFSEHESTTLLSDCINEFGRRVITWIAKSKEWVNFNPETKLYHCKKCGVDFTMKQHTFQTMNPVQFNATEKERL